MNAKAEAGLRLQSMVRCIDFSASDETIRHNLAQAWFTVCQPYDVIDDEYLAWESRQMRKFR